MNTSTIKISIKEETWNYLVFTVILETFARFGGLRLEFIRKRMHSLVNVENY